MRQLGLFLTILTLVVVLLLTSCLKEADMYNSRLKETDMYNSRLKETEKYLWQPIPTSVGYSTNDLLLIILERQRVINQKLDELLSENYEERR